MNNFSFMTTALKTNLRYALALKLSFYLNLFVAVLKQGLFLVSWYFFFQKYVDINGWDFNDLLLMNGFVLIGLGSVEFFFGGIKDLPRIVECNMLDSYLLQPKNVIFNIALSKTYVSALGDLLTGIIAIIFSGYFYSSFWLVLLMLPISILFIFSMYLYFGSLSFFMSHANEYIKELYQNVIIFATQPNSAYTGLLKWISLTIIPIGFISFFPVEFVKYNNFFYFLCAVAGTASFFFGACWFFYFGLKRYESGSGIKTKL